VTYVVWGAAGLTSLAVLAPAGAVLLDAWGAARSLTRRIACDATSRGFFLRGEYPTGLVRVAAVGVIAIAVTVPAHALQDAGVTIAGGMPFLLYLAMVAGIFVVAGAVRIKSRFRAMIPPITVPALVMGILLLEVVDSLLGLLPSRGLWGGGG
jgi:hypothetical protein